MKSIALLLTLLVLSACTSRSTPVSAAMAEVEPIGEQEVISMDLSPLSESNIGQALLGCVKEVVSVTITDENSGEVVYESVDDFLSQSFYDAIQLAEENLESMDAVVHDYLVEFDTALGIQKSYQIWLGESIIVQNENKIWTLPQSESDWLHSRLDGLA